MKKTIIFLIALIFVVSFTFGCNNSEVEELKEQVAELSEKLAEEEALAEQEEEVEELKVEEKPASIPWSEAKYHIGETITVYGPIVATSIEESTYGEVTWLDIGNMYPDPERFSVWIDSLNISKFSQAPDIYYYGKNISVTGLIVEVDGIPHMEVADPGQISEDEEVEKAVEEPSEEEPEEEPDTASTTEEETEEVVEEAEPVEEAVEETIEKVLTAPTISLEIIEGPAFSQLGDNTCYYRVRAHITGDPSPAISFNKDDSLGSLGGNISQVNLHNKGDSFTLEATATNSQGTASASITLSYTCQKHIPILVNNNTGGTLSLSLSGPASYNFSIPPGQQNIYVIPGTYNYTARGCGGAVESGTEDLSKSGNEWDWWCK